jgi:hypothetical protein
MAESPWIALNTGAQHPHLPYRVCDWEQDYGYFKTYEQAKLAKAALLTHVPLEREGVSDYPLDLAAAHGRIDAYRYALDIALGALLAAQPYIYNVACDPQNAEWRRDTAQTTLAQLVTARERGESELAVTNP